MTGGEVKDAKSEYGRQTEQGISKSSYYISMTFTDEGQSKFSAATKTAAAAASSGKNFISIEMDGNILTAPSG